MLAGFASGGKPGGSTDAIIVAVAVVVAMPLEVGREVEVIPCKFEHAQRNFGNAEMEFWSQP